MKFIFEAAGDDLRVLGRVKKREMRLNNTYSTHIASRYVLQRELGLKFPLGFRDKLHHKIYSSLQPSGSWDYSRSSSTKVANQISAGGVFNLEYSPDGSVFVSCMPSHILVAILDLDSLVHAFSLYFFPPICSVYQALMGSFVSFVIENYLYT